jgi:monoamine oxidase
MAHSQLFKKFKRTLQKAHQLNNLTSQKSPAVNPTSISKTKRRHFLRLAALAGGSAITATSFPRFTSAQSSANPQIAIVGGGIAGLNAAYNLKKAGLTATIYEGRRRVGGRIHSVTNKLGKDLVLEFGGSFINTNHQDMLRLVKEFNLQLFDRVKDANNSGFPVAAYYFDGKSYSEAEVAENLRSLAAQIATDASLIEQDSDRYTPEIDSLSVTQYLDKHQDTDLGFSELWDATGRQQERGDGALTFFFGGDEVAEMRLGSQPLQPLGQDILERFEKVIPEAKSAATNKFFRTGWSNDPFTRGAYTSWKPKQYLEFSQFFWIESADPQERQEVNIDNLVFAGEHVSDEFYGYMNGAAQTGRLAAEFVARKIEQ